MILARAPKGRLADRRAYEFFAGMDAKGRPTWTADIQKRRPVFTHARGRPRCCRSGISYNAALGRYLWWQQIRNASADTRAAGGFGVYDAPEPWGPWTTVYFTERWDVGPGETGCFPTKWMSADGRRVHLVFSGNDSFSVRQATLRVVPYPPSPVIVGIEWDFKSHRRLAAGSDNWPVTWADDGHLYTSWGDGEGFPAGVTGKVELGFARIEGDYPDFSAADLWGGRGKPDRPNDFAGKCYGLLCVGGVLYGWVRQPERSRWDGESHAVLIKSTDHGRTWSRPWALPLKEGFNTATLLNFSRDYAGARDGYVYSYIARSRQKGFFIEKPGRIDLARAPKDKLDVREAYEFFAGLNGRGQPEWTKDASARQAVFEDPNGIGWTLSVSYNPGLKRYLLATEHDQSFKGNLGLFDAPEPWGPWTTVAYESNWGGFGSTFFWNFPNKWLSAEGRRFVVVFTGTGRNDAWNTVQGTFRLRAAARKE
jgi:hypothetical protein